MEDAQKARRERVGVRCVGAYRLMKMQRSSAVSPKSDRQEKQTQLEREAGTMIRLSLEDDRNN